MGKVAREPGGKVSSHAFFKHPVVDPDLFLTWGPKDFLAFQAFRLKEHRHWRHFKKFNSAETIYTNGNLQIVAQL